MYIVLAIVAFLIVGGGVLYLSNATQGVGIIAVGCFFAILARMVQASEHHKQLLRILSWPEGERADRMRQTVSCPACGKPNLATRNTCHSCQADLWPTPANSPAEGRLT